MVGCGPLYSSMSLRSMKAWSHWENTDKQWCAVPPKYFPNYAQWQSEVTEVAQLSNPNSTAQQVLDAVRGFLMRNGASFSTAFGLITFSLWMELVLDIEGPTSALVSKELANRYSGFSLSRRLNSKQLFALSAIGRSITHSRLPIRNKCSQH